MNPKFEEIWQVISGSSNTLGDISVPSFLSLMAISFVSSLLIAYMYLYFYRNKATGTDVYRAFPLLGISITAIFICIQFSLALSLGLLGALSIVRFRTPIKEPEEIGFIMLVIAASIATATFNVVFLLILLTVAFVALLVTRNLLREFTVQRLDGMIVVTMARGDYKEHGERVEAVLKELFKDPSPDSVMNSGENMIATYRFAGLAGRSLSYIQTNLNDMFPLIDLKLYFHRAGSL